MFFNENQLVEINGWLTGLIKALHLLRNILTSGQNKLNLYRFMYRNLHYFQDPSLWLQPLNKTTEQTLVVDLVFFVLTIGISDKTLQLKPFLIMLTKFISINLLLT